MTAPDLTDAQLDRIRETIQPTIDDWRRYYEIPPHKSQPQLVNRVVAAIWSMHQCGVLEVKPINEEADRPESEVK